MDFKSLHQQTLPRLEELLTRIFPAGKVQGREFKIGSLRGEAGDSLSINLDTGVWMDFATGGTETGGDLASLLAAKLDFKMTDAGILVQTMLEDPNAGKKELRFILSGEGNKKSRVNPEAVAGPDPKWTNDNFIVGEWGSPTNVWEYRNSAGRLVFVVCRYGDSTTKSYRPWTWDGFRWQCKAYNEGRPLYNLHMLSKFPNARVIVVEGEKCADVAKQVLWDNGSHFVPVTWAGGSKAVNKTVWGPLAGRHVVIWPDADPPGYKAALDIAELLKGTAKSINIVNTQDLPPAADIADLELDTNSIIAWMDSNLNEVPISRPTEFLPEGGEWKKELQLTDRGGIRNSIHNVQVIVKNDTYFTESWWVEEWDGKFQIGDEPAGETEIFNARVHLSRHWGIEVSDEMMYKALDASLPRRNSIQEWLTSLKWDGTPRFGLLTDQVFKLPGNAYVAEVLQLLLTGMVARAMDPGCKFDYCIILRGPQGVGKTLFFEKLARERYVMLYSRTTQDKDILGAVATGWIVSIEELFDSRASLKELKSMISATVDTWRKPYHREMESQPKRCVLVGTTDAGADFLDDMAGYRRFLIIECGNQKFNLDLMEEIRDQLFAEAFARWKSTPEWYKLSAAAIGEANVITANWEVEDAWTAPIAEFLKDKDTTTMLEVLTNCLFIAASMHDSRVTKRAHRVLCSLGFERVRLRVRDGRLRAYQRRVVSDTEDQSPS